jgi:hypothetical protein
MTMRIAIEETGSMTHKELKAWRERLGLTQNQAACLLGMGDRTYQRHEAGGFFSSRVPGYLFSATHGVEAAIEKAEQLLKVSKWHCPRRFWNKALTPEEGRRWVLLAVACHVLARRPLSGHQELFWCNASGNTYVTFPSDCDT